MSPVLKTSAQNFCEQAPIHHKFVVGHLEFLEIRDYLINYFIKFFLLEYTKFYIHLLDTGVHKILIINLVLRKRIMKKFPQLPRGYPYQVFVFIVEHIAHEVCGIFVIFKGIIHDTILGDNAN